MKCMRRIASAIIIFTLITIMIFNIEVEKVHAAVSFGFPVNNTSTQMTCGYLAYSGHYGYDLGCSNGTELYALFGGTATYYQTYDVNTKKSASYGNYVEIVSSDGKYRTKYCHLERFNGFNLSSSIISCKNYPSSSKDVTCKTITIGSRKVSEGELIGYSGTTGNSTGPHLHLELKINGSYVNPNDYITRNYTASSRDNVNPPTNPQIHKSQVWYDLADTVKITAYADYATDYYMSMYKNGEHIIKGIKVPNGIYSIAASAEGMGLGDYSVYFSCTNSTGPRVDTEWIDFSIVGEPSYTDIWTSKGIYELGDTVAISVNTICADGQVIGIDKNGVERVVTAQSDSNTYTISASEKGMGIGTYSAYFSVYNDYKSIDTSRIAFVIAEPCDLGTGFYARIKHQSSEQYVARVSNNVEGEPLKCERSYIWRFDKQSDGSYKIISALDGGAMDVTDYGNAGNGTNIQINSSWETTAQKFKVYQAYGAYYIKPVCCEMFLDMEQKEPYNLQTWYGGGDWPNQEFEIIKVDETDLEGHKYQKEITKEPTSTDEGIVTYTCSVCGESYTEPIEKKQEAPYNMQVVLENPELNTNDTLKVLASVEGGVEYYKIQIWRGSERVLSEEFTGHEFTAECSTLGVGEYGLYVTAVNKEGTVTSDTYMFVIKEETEIVAEGWSGDTTWTLTDDGCLTFAGEGVMKNYKTKDEMPWYGHKDQIRSVVIEDGVTRIGDYAFYGMPVMESIVIPETVTNIGHYAFKNATALDGVELPSELTQLGESAFYGCTSLTAIEIPASLWTVKPYTFKNCTALASVTFNEGNLQKISDGSFYNTAVTKLELPDCLDILDVYSFKNCASLADITIGSGLTELREAVFYGTAIDTIIIPEGITKVGPYVFKNCKNLDSVQMPVTLTSIGESAFYGCTEVTELVIPDNVTTLHGYAFKNCTGLTSVELPESLLTIGESTFHTCTSLESLIIPGSVTALGEYCFSGSYNLWKLTFEGNAPAIGTGAFKGIVATAYYPADDATWTENVMQNHGGSVSWKMN